MPISGQELAGLQAACFVDGILTIQSNNQVTDLEGLDFADMIEKIHIRNCDGLKSLDGIQRMINLIELRIVDSNLAGTDLSALRGENAAKIKYLDVLQVKNCGLTDLGAFEDLVAVSDVDFSDNSIESLGPLHKYRYVKSFDISNNKLTNIDDCKIILTFIPLESISIYGNPLSKNMSEVARKKFLFSLPEDIKHIRLKGKDDEIEQLGGELERVHEVPLEEDETYNQYFIMTCYEDLQSMYDRDGAVRQQVEGIIQDNRSMMQQVERVKQRNDEMIKLYEEGLRKLEEAQKNQRELETLFAAAKERVSSIISDISENQR